jgi:hypothetical protein
MKSKRAALEAALSVSILNSRKPSLALAFPRFGCCGHSRLGRSAA